MARDYSLKGLLFASAATTGIPASPVTGVPYRNASLTSGVAGNGWPFGVIVDSADFNEMMYKITSLLDYIEKTGALVWSQYTDYVIGSLVRDDSFNFWEATAASGPNNGGYATPTIGSASWKIAKFNFYGGGEKIVFNTTNYTAAANDCVFCRNGGITVSMPASPKNNDRIRIVTSSSVGSSSTVTISATKIQQTGVTTILMDQPNSIVEFVYDATNSMWVLGSTIRGGHLKISGGTQLQFITPVTLEDVDNVIPPGTIITTFSETIPTGYLECNGAAISRTTYSRLFTAIGTRAGAGDESTTFNLPDFRGYFLRGWDHGAGNDPDAATRTDSGNGTAGDHVGTKQQDELESHSHDFNTASQYSTVDSIPEADIKRLLGDSRSTGTFQAADAAINNQHYIVETGGNETRPKNINVLYCIKY